MAPNLAAQDYLRLQVAEPYIEMHTGPGRGFPIFHVVDRHDWIEIIKRRTDWFKVRSSDGNIGWAYIEQMELTLATPNQQTKFAVVEREQFLTRRYEMGIQTGDFEGASLIAFFGALNFNKNLSADFSFAQAVGKFTNSELYNLNLISYPFPDWRYSPFFTLGFGHFRNKPRSTFINVQETSDVTANVGLGLKVYLARRFVFRADAKHYVSFMSDEDNGEFFEWKVGFSFFY